MQFKHPEILWALFLLLIPILIHLFQLRRFQKTPFTNVAMLQKVVAESRKSRSLKKWLLLLTRLLLVASLVIAFAQPFRANQTALQEQEYVIYLDNSFSMQARNNGITLLQEGIQELIKNFDDETMLSLFTNENTFRNVQLQKIKNSLLSIPYTHEQLDLEEIQLKARTLFTKSPESTKNLILVSDFQERISPSQPLQDSLMQLHWVSLHSGDPQNYSIDSVYVAPNSTTPNSLEVLVSGGNPDENLPISLYDAETLIAKNAAKFDSSGEGKVSFTIPSGEMLQGKVQITDNALLYDNNFYFNLDEKPKINVLAIGESGSNYLERIYTEDEFSFKRSSLSQLDYSSLDRQNVLVLEGLKEIPTSLQRLLHNFHEEGGTIIIIPSEEAELTNYNQFLAFFGAHTLKNKINNTLRITDISFQHPLYQYVFEREVTNFQYPSVNRYFEVVSGLPRILKMEGNTPFLIGEDGLYIFLASLAPTNSNFSNSPLIVPTFYNMALSALQSPKIYHELGQTEDVDIATELAQDNILKVVQNDFEFIPQQQRFSNRVRLTFDENPTKDGIYAIMKNNETLRNISFNYPRNESQLTYLDLSDLPRENIHQSIAELTAHLEAANDITAYWKWFVILALLLVLLEVIIQKFVA